MTLYLHNVAFVRPFPFTFIRPLLFTFYYIHQTFTIYLPKGELVRPLPFMFIMLHSSTFTLYLYSGIFIIPLSFTYLYHYNLCCILQTFNFIIFIRPLPFLLFSLLEAHMFSQIVIGVLDVSCFNPFIQHN